MELNHGQQPIRQKFARLSVSVLQLRQDLKIRRQRLAQLVLAQFTMQISNALLKSGQPIKQGSDIVTITLQKRPSGSKQNLRDPISVRKQRHEHNEALKQGRCMREKLPVGMHKSKHRYNFARWFDYDKTSPEPEGRAQYQNCHEE